jgi:phosphate starvation-inducible protein PhoH and related proteins
LPQIALPGGNDPPAPAEGRPPRQHTAVFEIVVTRDRELRPAACRRAIEDVAQRLDPAARATLLIFKDNLRHARTGARLVVPKDRVVLPKPLPTFLDAHRAMKAPQFLVANQGIAAAVLADVPKLELLHLKRFARSRASPQNERRQQPSATFHEGDPSSPLRAIDRTRLARIHCRLMTTREAAEIKLEFDTPQFLHALFANDPKNLAYLESQLGVRAVTREGWIVLSGEFEALERARAVFTDLEGALRKGSEIDTRDFRLAVDVATASGPVGVSELSGVRLVGSRGRKPVIPRTPNQLQYVRAIETHDVVFGLGPAGTGKTYLAMAMALTLLKRRQIQRVILTRPAVEAGEALGFLPGDLREKVAPYLRPLYDAIHDMLDPDEAQRYLEDSTIEIAPLAFMRGRTLSRSFVILDEAQNTTREQMFMTLTRLGEESRMVITGDGSQVDLKPGVRSGLIEAEHALEGIEGIAFMRFERTDIVRHPVVGRIVEAYERYRA